MKNQKMISFKNWEFIPNGSGIRDEYQETLMFNVILPLDLTLQIKSLDKSIIERELLDRLIRMRFETDIENSPYFSAYMAYYYGDSIMAIQLSLSFEISQDTNEVLDIRAFCKMIVNNSFYMVSNVYNNVEDIVQFTYDDYTYPMDVITLSYNDKERIYINMTTYGLDREVFNDLSCNAFCNAIQPILDIALKSWRTVCSTCAAFIYKDITFSWNIHFYTREESKNFGNSLRMIAEIKIIKIKNITIDMIRPDCAIFVNGDRDGIVPILNTYAHIYSSPDIYCIPDTDNMCVYERAQISIYGSERMRIDFSPAIFRKSRFDMVSENGTDYYMDFDDMVTYDELNCKFYSVSYMRKDEKDTRTYVPKHFRHAIECETYNPAKIDLLTTELVTNLMPEWFRSPSDTDNKYYECTKIEMRLIYPVTNSCGHNMMRYFGFITLDEIESDHTVKEEEWHEAEKIIPSIASQIENAAKILSGNLASTISEEKPLTSSEGNIATMTEESENQSENLQSDSEVTSKEKNPPIPKRKKDDK